MPSSHPSPGTNCDHGWSCGDRLSSPTKPHAIPAIWRPGRLKENSSTVKYKQMKINRSSKRQWLRELFYLSSEILSLLWSFKAILIGILFRVYSERGCEGSHFFACLEVALQNVISKMRRLHSLAQIPSPFLPLTALTNIINHVTIKAQSAYVLLRPQWCLLACNS